jgi:hypothetical protein
MDLDDATRAELAAFFARRFPSAADRGRICRAAGLTDPGGDDAGVAWTTILAAAGRTASLARLADAAVATAPNDRNLQDMRVLLTRSPAPRPTARWVGMGAIAVVGVGLSAWAVWPRGDAPAPVARTTPAAQGAPAATPTPGAAAAAVAPTATAATTPATTPAITPATAPGTTQATTPTASATAPAARASAAPAPAAAPPGGAPPAAPSPSAASSAQAAPVPSAGKSAPATPVAARSAPAPSSTGTGRPIPTNCRGPAGERVGYWYAGTTAPWAKGADIVLPSAVNIRADYPHDTNHFAKNGQVLCSVSAGTRQHLTEAPIPVAGHFWVPVYGGDLGGG